MQVMCRCYDEHHPRRWLDSFEAIVGPELTVAWDRDTDGQVEIAHLTKCTNWSAEGNPEAPWPVLDGPFEVYPTADQVGFWRYLLCLEKWVEVRDANRQTTKQFEAWIILNQAFRNMGRPFRRT